MANARFVEARWLPTAAMDREQDPVLWVHPEEVMFPADVFRTAAVRRMNITTVRGGIPNRIIQLPVPRMTAGAVRKTTGPVPGTTTIPTTPGETAAQTIQHRHAAATARSETAAAVVQPEVTLQARDQEATAEAGAGINRTI